MAFSLDIPVEDTNGNTVMQSVAINTELDVSLTHTFNRLAKEIDDIVQTQNRCYLENEEKAKRIEPVQPRFSLGPTDDDIRFSIAEPDDAD